MTHGHDRVAPRDAVVEVLLEENLGGWTPRDVSAAVATAFAADGGAGAAARAEQPWPAASRPRSWLVAAVVLLGLSVLFAVAWSRARGDRGVAQEPQPAEPAAGEVLPVQDLARLRELLPQVVRVELEVLQLADPDLPAIDVAGVPVRATDAWTRAFTAALADGARMQDPAGWQWQNRLSLVLRSGRHVAMAVSPYDRGAGQTLGLRGLQGDLLLTGDGVPAVRELLATATHAARLAHGVVVRAADLVGDGAFPANVEQLRLFGITDADLEHLRRFPALRRLDASGLYRTLGVEGLRHIGACSSLEELSLAGASLPDRFVPHLARLRRLLRLDLRGVRDFFGGGFRTLRLVGGRRDGPTAVDLRDVPTLTDAGLASIVEFGVSDLRLGGSQTGIGAEGWRALMAGRGLTHLDLSGWTFADARFADLAGLPQLEELTLDDCALDDAALVALARTKAPLRRLSLRRVQGLTLAGWTAICELPTLREVDLTGVTGLDLDEMSQLAFFHPDIRWVR